MASKGAKRKRGKKPGRPCKAGVARAQSGRISRASNPAEAPDKLAKRMRAKMHGLSDQEAEKQEAGTVIGRLSLMGQQGGGLSQDQYEVLKEYGELRAAYVKSIQAPDSLASKGVGGSLPDDVDMERRTRTKQRYDEARKVILACQIENAERNLFAAVDHMVIRDEYHQHMIGDIRLVGNALHRHYRGVARARMVG